MPIVETYPVVVEGIGRVDYSNAVEITTEPVITSWQNVFTFSELVAPIPAGGSLAVNMPIPSDLVVIIYDYFASIPANRLIRLVVEMVDPAGPVITVLDELAYQTVSIHLLRGKTFVGSIRYTLYNYAATPETGMRIGAAGIYTTEDQFTLHISP